MTSVEGQLEEADRRYQVGAEILGGYGVLLFVLVLLALLLGGGTCESPQSPHLHQGSELTRESMDSISPAGTLPITSAA